VVEVTVGALDQPSRGVVAIRGVEAQPTLEGLTMYAVAAGSPFRLSGQTGKGARGLPREIPAEIDEWQIGIGREGDVVSRQKALGIRHLVHQALGTFNQLPVRQPFGKLCVLHVVVFFPQTLQALLFEYAPEVWKNRQGNHFFRFLPRVCRGRRESGADSVKNILRIKTGSRESSYTSGHVPSGGSPPSFL
jgi:hypothetical protein